MAITETRSLPAKFIEDLGKDYGKQLTAATASPLDTSKFAPAVAGQTALQKQATALTGSGIGSYQPYVTAAGTAGTAAGTALGAAGTGLGVAGSELTGAGTALGQAGSTIGGVSPFIGAAGTGLGTAAGLTGTGTGTGTGSISSYMSPYQSQVIDTTLADFDRQAAQRQQAISDQAVALGGFGGGREGVMQSEYQTGSDRNRASLQAQLLQQGFGQGTGLRQQDLTNQMGLAQGQLGLGQATLGLGQAQAGMAGQQAAFSGQRGALAAQQGSLAQGQLGLGQFQQGLGGALQTMQGSDIARAGQVGSADQAQSQANLTALQEANRLKAYEPLERLGIYGQGVTGLMGGYPAQYQFTSQPNASPLAQALGVASTLGGVYGNVTGNNKAQSDIQLKENIKLTGKSPLGLNVYNFKYKGKDGIYQGVMAQEVPWASSIAENGYLQVDYSKVDVEFKRLN
jgi:hypothetical protein